MPIPHHLESYAKILNDGCQTIVELRSAGGNGLLNVRFFGSLRGELIINDPSPLLITANDPISGEEFVVFDSAKHGYDAVTWYICEIPCRKMCDYPISPLKLTVTLEYDEPDDFPAEVDPALYREAFTWITVEGEDENGQKHTLLEFETA